MHIEWTRNLGPDGAFKPAAELREMYEAAGVTPDREVLTYCQGGYRAAHAYLALRLLGYPRVRNYVGSWKEWGDREDLPVEVPGKDRGPGPGTGRSLRLRSRTRSDWDGSTDLETARLRQPRARSPAPDPRSLRIMNNIIDFINTHRDRYVDELKAYLAIPSISALPEHAADVRALRRMDASPR